MQFMRLHLPATNDMGEAAYFEDGYTGERQTFPSYHFLTKRYPRAKLDEIQSAATPYYWLAALKWGNIHADAITIDERYLSGRLVAAEN